MRALFTGGLGDFIGAESFMTDAEKDAVTTVLWATRNRKEICAAVDLKSIFPNMVDEQVMFDDFCDERPTRPWQPGDRFINIHTKIELNTKCGLNLTEAELAEISDHSLDATLADIFAGRRRFVSSRIALGSDWPAVDQFNLPEDYVVIHPWSDAEINGREFTNADWHEIFVFLDRYNITGVVVNQSTMPAPAHPRILDLTNKTTLKETFSIIQGARGAVLCASSLACLASKMFEPGSIWIKGGYPHMFTEWATYFYHGPYTNPNMIIHRDLSVLNPRLRSQEQDMLDQGLATLL